MSAEAWLAWLDDVESVLARAEPAAVPEAVGLPPLPPTLAGRAGAVLEQLEARAIALRGQRDAVVDELARLGAARAQQLGREASARPAFLDASA